MSYLKVTNIKKTISDNYILKGINFELEKGKVLVILGKSGAGKTTLLRNLNFLDFPDEGTIELDGKIIYNSNSEPLSNKELQKTHKLIGLVFQNFNLFPHLTVLKNCMLAEELEINDKLKQFKKNNKSKKEQQAYYNNLITEAQQKALLILDELGLSDKIDKYPYQLSGGEQQRVSIARALVLNPKILCFDEPTSALDPGLTGEVVKLINELKEQKLTMIIITHEMDFAYQVADKIIVIDKGQIIEEKEM
jgi:polar amino acid transport system ATP-binding protein